MINVLKLNGYPRSIKGNMIQSELPNVSIGEVCEIFTNIYSKTAVARAQVVAFEQKNVWLNLLGSANGMNNSMIIKPTGKLLTIKIQNSILGTVVNALGTETERLAPVKITPLQQERLIDNDPPSYINRVNISEKLETGIRAIDGLLTCGIGQRIGIFASAGCGKTVLMHMLLQHADADVFVIGLIGERGREVTECAEALRKSDIADRCVMVYATSDFSAVDRSNAAHLATTIAEFFRDQGKRVVLFIDSMTRYARALRDMKLAAGEPPARRGYPASVFDNLPRLLERPGRTVSGSITAFYTVLLESEDETDPLGEEIRSILDGHIYLSRDLAGKGHYPAIDILKSISRVFGQITTTEHRMLTNEIRKMLSTLDSLQMLIDLGEYKPGQNAVNDKAVNSAERINAFLCQGVDEKCPFDETIDRMNDIVN